ncbi:hypothetical protein P9850_01795 [Anoxybacillus rupiensis]|uniref:Uncharacterized protein n=1 Tax=Anoxybacteroides rupiense TaxID=311460 RepID=A0ABD5IQP0_9BACL|nr:hypothetical protein [Anoxybacillus rupiensis]
MEQEKTVDELLDELDWGWLPLLLVVLWVVVYGLVGWLDHI